MGIAAPEETKASIGNDTLARVKSHSASWLRHASVTLASIGVVLGIWWLITWLRLALPVFIPPPSTVWEAFTATMTEGYRGATLYAHLGVSLGRLFVAFGIALATAIPLGLLVSSSRKIQAALQPLVNFYRVLPPLAYYTTLIIWLGIGEASKVALLALAVFPPIFIGVISGVRSIPGDRVNAAFSLGAGRGQVMRYITLPSVLPDIFTGFRVGIGFGYTTLVAAEMVAANRGIGWMVWDAARYLQSDVIFLGIIVMGFTGIALDVVASCGGGGAARTGGGAVGSSEPLQIAYQVIPNTAPIVKHEGWLEEELDVPVKFNQFASGSDVVRAVAAGDVDVGLVGSVGVAAAIARDLPVQTVWIYDVIFDAEALVARQGSGIKSVEDLSGKKVGTPFGSTTQYALGKALEFNGVDASKVQVIDMKPNQIVAALQRGDIDAGYTWHPTLYKAMQSGAHIVFTSGDLVDRGVLTTDLGIASTQLVKERPKVVQGWLRAQNRAAKMLQDNPDKAAGIIADELGLKEKVVKVMIGDYKYLNGQEQTSQDYLGSPGATDASDVEKSLVDTGKFLEDIKVIDDAPSLKAVRDAVNPAPLRQAVEGSSR